MAPSHMYILFIYTHTKGVSYLIELYDKFSQINFFIKQIIILIYLFFKCRIYFFDMSIFKLYIEQMTRPVLRMDMRFSISSINIYCVGILYINLNAK